MNLRQEHSANAFISVMPAELREIYMDNSPRDFHANTIFTFEQFIDLSFTWSDTAQGRSFWSQLAQFRTAEQLKNWRDLLPSTGREILDKMPAELRALFFAEYDYQNKRQGFTTNAEYEYTAGNNTLDLFKQNRSYSSYIGAFFTFDSSLCGRAFWDAVRSFGADVNPADIVALCNTKLKEIKLYNGETAPLYLCAKLTDDHYPANSYARREETIKTNVGIILQSDSVSYRDSYGDLMTSHRKTIEQDTRFVFDPERDIFLHVDVAHRYGLGREYPADNWIKVDPQFHGIIDTPNGWRFFALDLTAEDPKDQAPEGIVYVNERQQGFNYYLHKNSYKIYQCAVSGLYYSQDSSTFSVYNFVNEARQSRRIKVSENTQVSPLFEIEGQRFAPIIARNRDGNNERYWNIESAMNEGLIFSTCPHCNSLESQYHDRDRCARVNFKNERYSYHSKKPRYISSRSQFKIGVEIEKESYEGAGHSCYQIYDRFGWVKESDGSLDSTTGYELVSPTFGLFGNNLMKEAEAIEARFPLLINGDASNACGGHIHFSRANTSGRDTLEMYCGYLPLLYAIYKGRTKQHYCQGKEKEEMKRSGEKYQAVRVLDNRIEFRIFPKVKNLSTLQWRIELLRYIAKHPTANPVQVVNDLCDKRTKLHALFLQIFSEQTIYKRALDTLTMAQKYDRNFYNIDFTAERKTIETKAQKASK